MTDAITVAAHAKINLFLRVLSREDSGYHGIETVFALIDLADEIRVERISQGGGVELTVAGADTGPADDNLCVRAARRVLEATGNKFGVHIHLEKHIPVQAGLGGGSTDGAATLNAVNHLADNAIPKHELLQFATQLGADVPFFVSGAPMALGWNRGERLFRLNPPRSAPLLLAVPPFGISTPDAYRLIDEGGDWARPRGSIVLDHDAVSTWGSLGRLGGNDFEAVAFGREPRLRALYEAMAETRPLLVRMSGSGSAIAAVYKSPSELEDAAMVLGTRDWELIKTSTRDVPG